MSEEFKRFHRNGLMIKDYYTDKVIATVQDSKECDKIVNCLNELENNHMETIDKIQELQDKLNEANSRYDNILELIDIRVKENKQLALLHFPEPEDNYINEYDSRARELEQLKKLILTGKE